MGITTDRNDPDLGEIQPNGQQKSYLALSEEERAKGFERPVRTTYKHVGQRPTYPLHDLTEDEHARLDQYAYVKYEAYPDPAEDGSSVTGRFWTAAQLSSGCGLSTTMGLELAETWARDRHFYGATMCVHCGGHYPVAEFVWVDSGEVLGS